MATAVCEPAALAAAAPACPPLRPGAPQEAFEDEGACAGRSSKAAGPGLLDLPGEMLFEALGCLSLSPRDLCAVSLTCASLRPLAEHDSFWEELFNREFPRLVPLLDATQPAWWARRPAGRGGSWKARFGELSGGAPFTAQVFNREQDNEHEDFMLSCYDATLRLLPCTARQGAAEEAGGPLFEARYHAMGCMPEVVEAGVQQGRLRAPPPCTTPYDVFSGDSAEGLRVGDEVEVQWKGRRGHPFGWWFGTVQAVRPGGRRVTLVFRQYPAGSVWRRVKAALRPGKEGAVNGDCSFGFVGGLRRLSLEELSEWRRHFPAPVPAPPAGEEPAEDWASDGEEELPADFDAEPEADAEAGAEEPGGEAEPEGGMQQTAEQGGILLLGVPHLSATPAAPGSPEGQR